MVVGLPAHRHPGQMGLGITCDYPLRACPVDPSRAAEPNLAARSGSPPNTMTRAMPVGVTVRTPSP